MLKRQRGTNEWSRVGSVTVDSGRCLVVDPTYHRDGFYGVEEVGEAVMASVRSDSGAAPLIAPDGQELGVVLATGYGDDEYPVEVRYMTDDRGVKRIAEVRVRFIDDA
jgi:hypothetical protein